MNQTEREDDRDPEDRQGELRRTSASRPSSRPRARGWTSCCGSSRSPARPSSLAVKIGGCEAVRDLLESKQIGVSYIIAPMVETPYALSKYALAKDKPCISRRSARTPTSCSTWRRSPRYENREAIVALAAETGGVDGMVFGRVDFFGSLGLDRDAHQRARASPTTCSRSPGPARSSGLDLVVGGGVSMDALDGAEADPRTCT